MADRLEPDLAPGGVVFVLEAGDGLELERVRAVDGIAYHLAVPEAVETTAARHRAYVEAHGGRALAYDGDTGGLLAVITPEDLEVLPELEALEEAAIAEAAALGLEVSPLRLREDGPL